MSTHLISADRCSRCGLIRMHVVSTGATRYIKASADKSPIKAIAETLAKMEQEQRKLLKDVITEVTPPMTAEQLAKIQNELSFPSNFPGDPDAEPDDDEALLCVWCGHQCLNAIDLEVHEEECSS